MNIVNPDPADPQLDEPPPPDVQVGLFAFLTLSLVLIPLAWVFYNGPSGTFPAQALAGQFRQNTAANPTAARLMHLATTYKAAAWGLILAQGFVMSMVVIAVAARAEATFPRRLAGLWAALFMVGSLEWLRWSALVAPDPLANSAASLGILALMTQEQNRRNLRIFWILCGLTCLAAAGLLVHFWWMVLASLATWLLASRLQQPFRIALTIITTSICMYVYMPGLVADLISQTPQQEVLPGQVLGGYPDFQVDAGLAANPGRAGFAYLRAKVALVRVGLELAQIRSVYSWKHNLAILLAAWPILVLSLFGIVRYGRRPVGVICLIASLVWALMVGSAYADWDGRFLPAIWPVLALAASGPASALAARPAFWKSLVCMVLLMILAIAFRYPVLESVGQWLVVDDRRPGQLIVILVGGDPDRDRLAVELFQQGHAHEIWFANDRDLPETDPANDAGKLAYRLVEKGVPRSQIQLLPSARNTTDEARRVAQRLATMPPASRPRSVSVVTTGFHSRRAFMTFRKYLKPMKIDVYMAASTDDTLPLHEWWLHPRTRSTFTQELAKIVFSWLGLG